MNSAEPGSGVGTPGSPVSRHKYRKRMLLVAPADCRGGQHARIPYPVLAGAAGVRAVPRRRVDRRRGLARLAATREPRGRPELVPDGSRLPDRDLVGWLDDRLVVGLLRPGNLGQVLGGPAPGAGPQVLNHAVHPGQFGRGYPPVVLIVPPPRPRPREGSRLGVR